MKTLRYRRLSGPSRERTPRNVPPDYWDQQSQWWEKTLRSEKAHPTSAPVLRGRNWTRWAWLPAAAALAIWGWLQGYTPSSQPLDCVTFECQLAGITQDQDAPQWVLQEVLNDPELSDQIILESLP